MKLPEKKVELTMKTDRLFQILIVIFIAAAAYFGWTGYKDGVFVSLVFASVCFFLSIRFQAKGRMKQRNLELEKDKQEV